MPFSPSVPDALRALRNTTKNKIILAGFARGARWVDEVILCHADLFDFAVAIAPYPRNKDKWQGKENAREVMQVNRPIMYVSFASDEFYNAATYMEWFKEFELGMEPHSVSDRPGCRRETFGFFMVRGLHSAAADLFQTFDFQRLGNAQLTQFWEAALAALGGGARGTGHWHWGTV